MTDLQEIKNCLSQMANVQDPVSELLPALLNAVYPEQVMRERFNIKQCPNEKLKTPSKTSKMNLLDMRQNIIFNELKEMRKEVESLKQTVLNINSVLSIILSMNKVPNPQMMNTTLLNPTFNPMPAPLNMTTMPNMQPPINVPFQTAPNDLTVAQTQVTPTVPSVTTNNSQNALTATKGSTTIQFEKPVQLICWLKQYVPEGMYPVYNECLELAKEFNALGKNDAIPAHLLWLSDWKLVPKTDLNFFFKLINDHYASSICKKNNQNSVSNIPENLSKTPEPTQNEFSGKLASSSPTKLLEAATSNATPALTQHKKSKFSNMWSDFRKRINRPKNMLSNSKIIPSLSSTFISKRGHIAEPKKRPRSESSIDLSGSNMTLNNLDPKKLRSIPDDEMLRESSENEENDFVFNKPQSEDDKAGKYIGEVVPSITEGLYAILDLSMWRKCINLCLKEDKNCFNSLKNNSLYNGYLTLYFPVCFDDSKSKEDRFSKKVSFNPQKSILWDRLSSHQRLFFLELLFTIIKTSDLLSENHQSYFESILPPYERVIDKIKIFMVIFACDSIKDLGTRIGSEITKSYSEPSISLVLSLLLDCLKIDYEIPENIESKDYVGKVLRQYVVKDKNRSMVPYVEFVLMVLNEESESGFLNNPKNISQDPINLKSLFSQIKEELVKAEKNFYAALDASMTSEEENLVIDENHSGNDVPVDKENSGKLFIPEKTEDVKVNKRKILQPQKLV